MRVKDSAHIALEAAAVYRATGAVLKSLPNHRQSNFAPVSRRTARRQTSAIANHVPKKKARRWLAASLSLNWKGAVKPLFRSIHYERIDYKQNAARWRIAQLMIIVCLPPNICNAPFSLNGLRDRLPFDWTLAASFAVEREKAIEEWREWLRERKKIQENPNDRKAECQN